MRVIFAGTPEFARVALTAIHNAGHEIVAVLTQPDRPAGRGMKLTPSAVKQEAIHLNIPVLQPLTLKSSDIQQQLITLNADVMVVAAYGLILPQAVLDMPKYGCLNIHASLLPRWRGAAPIHRAILAGDSTTGITIMQMDAGLDTGAMLTTETIAIADDDSTGSLHDKLATLGGTMIVETLGQITELTPVPQPEAGVTYAAKITKAEALLDFNLPAQQLARNIRAFNPAPGAYFLAQEKIIKVWQAHVVDQSGTPAKLISADAHGITIACQQQALCITELQPAGGKRLSAAQFIAGPGVEFLKNTII
ncbi:methionyl-tRNA formyltransferase [Sulfuriferula nivalis]|uniref:Methionyl-tRNA formyltransferase n=1 Tax=Sulfuriferula nivalis TaxID=2675298 RepID=A0A809RYX2_9PROT|nr:methionyl-tRNA formyltransferase [Sulfuriferula nivalis]BBO99397.1 methionyl-tRNA formyltransferase [Sulfuriferula nivalis]